MLSIQAAQAMMTKNHSMNGLVYQPCGSQPACAVQYQGVGLPFLYHEAVEQCMRVSQHNYVYIYWMGRCVGNLRGLA